jgi:predicted esterase
MSLVCLQGNCRFWGNPNHLNFVTTSLREKHPEDNLHVLVAKRNSGSFTYDGIELGGERLTNEIEEELEELARSGHDIKKISIIGYSLGGLISRYAIGLLYHKGVFQRVEPVVCTVRIPRLVAT